LRELRTYVLLWPELVNAQGMSRRSPGLIRIGILETREPNRIESRAGWPMAAATHCAQPTRAWTEAASCAHTAGTDHRLDTSERCAALPRMEVVSERLESQLQLLVVEAVQRELGRSIVTLEALPRHLHDVVQSSAL